MSVHRRTPVITAAVILLASACGGSGDEDVYKRQLELSRLFDLDDLCELAGRIDTGFTQAALAEALGSIDRFADSDFPVGAVAPGEIREFAHRCRASLG